MPSKIAIILLNWNGKRDTLECLASLQKVQYSHFQPIVVDNGSSDGSVDLFRASFPQIPILETEENLGFAGGNNVGIEWALRHHAEWILLLNNDTIADPHFLSAFMSAAKEKPAGKIFGAKILRYHDPETIDHLGGFWEPSLGEFRCPHSGQKDHSYFQMEQADYVCGAGLLMHRSVPETIGSLEPNYFLFWEESDFCYRAKRAGFEIWTVPEAKIWHKGSSSFIGGKPHMHYFWWRSRLLWIERNCTPDEKKILYRKVVFPQIGKMVRHYLLRSGANLLFAKEKRKEKAHRLKAGLLGVLDYYRKRFGDCPKKVLLK